MRGGAFKPRTSPYSFQGLGEEGLRYLSEAREQTGLPIITEVMSPEQIEQVADYSDILQVGARNTQNYSLLKALGQQYRQVTAIDNMHTHLTYLFDQRKKFGIHLWCAACKIQRFNTFLLYKIKHICDCFCSHDLFASRPRIDVTVQTLLVAAVTEIDLQCLQQGAANRGKVGRLQLVQCVQHQTPQ